ncbi:hypothetical protein HS125_02690 [bacterium]|nr:hypothetical protein [bacterium]
MALLVLIASACLEDVSAQTLSTVAGAPMEGRAATGGGPVFTRGGWRAGRRATSTSPTRSPSAYTGATPPASSTWPPATAGYRRLGWSGGDPATTGDGGPAADCTFNTISGLAVDSSGRLYIADTFNHRIRRIELSGTITTVVGTGQAGFNGDGMLSASAQLNRPRGIYIHNDRLFVADSANHRIRFATEDGRLYTFAGVGTPGNSGNNGPARNAQLNLPSDLTFDTLGNAYIADTNNNVIRRVNTGGIITLFMGGGNDDDGTLPTTVKLIGPTAIDTDTADDSFYVADTGQQRIRLWRDGSIRPVAGNGIPGYAGDGFLAIFALVNFPQDVLVLPDRSCLVADTDNGRIRRISPAPLSGIETYAGEGDTGIGAGDGEDALSAILFRPSGIAGRPGGGFYVSDTGHNRVRVVLPDGTIQPFAGTGQPGLSSEQTPALSAMMAGPTGLVLDVTGRVYIADTQNHRVRLVGAGGNIRTFAGSTRGSAGENVPAPQAQLNTPIGLAMDATGNLYIADSGNHKIRRVSPNAIITTYAGTGTAGSAGVGGSRTAVQLRAPAGVAVGPDGQVYIADTGQ